MDRLAKEQKTTTNEGLMNVNESLFIRVEEVAQELEVSKGYAYKVVQKLNAKLKEQGYMTIAGRTNRKYYEKKIYGKE